MEQTFKSLRGTLRSYAVMALTICSLLTITDVFAQNKQPLPLKPRFHAQFSRAASFDYVPSGYEQIGTTDLCYLQNGYSIDVKGYFNGSWYRSTFSDGGYRVAMSVTKDASSTEEKSIFGSYTITSWIGTQEYWYSGVCQERYTFEDGYYTLSVQKGEENQITFANICNFGGNITGIIDYENRTITFPAQSIYLDGWGYNATFCKDTPAFAENPIEENATDNVVLSFDDTYNMSLEGWALLITMGDESCVYRSNILAMQPNEEGFDGTLATSCNSGEIYNGVQFVSHVEQQGELARICYTVTNTNNVDVTISLGTHADVMIGDNDRAPISKRIDLLGNDYGLTMKDGNGAQLCVLFGNGLAGVTSIDDYWFGYYYLNSDPEQMIGNYNQGENYMEENGSYDSGMGWCWKNRVIPAGQSVVFSYLMGVGEVNLEPNSSFEVTPDDPEGWNDLSRPHRLTLNGSYESPAGLEGVIDYAVEGSEEWTALTGTLSSGDEFTASLVAMFDATKSTHVIRFRTRDLVGNTTMLHPIEYKDVSFHALTGIEEKTYTGDSLFQTNITCDIEEGQYELKTYRNNVNAGTASFNLEGVFPYTIGRKTYTFTINPQPLSGELSLADTEFVYSGQAFTPEWQFANGTYGSLEEGKDYEIAWSDNKLPGTGSLTVSGKNNYTGSLTATFNIDKALLTGNLYSLTLPAEDITYDEQTHGASITTAEGVGEATLLYMKQGDTEPTTVLPSEAGDYTVYLEFADGMFYYGMERTQVGAFSIYQFNAEEWTILQTVLPKLSEMGWSQPWDVSQGMKSVSSLHGLTIEKGKVVGLDLGNASLTGLFPVKLFAFTNLKSLSLSDNNLEGAVETIADYIQQNPGVGINLSELNIANNSLSGNIGIMAACFPNMTSIDAHGNHLSDIYPMISNKVVSIDISGQTIDRTVTYDLSSTTMEELASQIPTILLYDHGLQNYTKPLNLQYSMEDGFGMTLSYANGHFAISDVSEQNAFHGESGDIIEVTALDTDVSKANSTMKLKLLFETGDANFINGLDIADLQSTILYAFDDYPSYLPFNFTAADTYKDNLINVQDVVSTVNLLLSIPAQNQMPMRKSKENLSYEENLYEDNQIWIEDGIIMLKTVTPIAAMSIDISSSAELDLSKYGMNVVSRGTRAIAYSLTGGYLSEGIHKIGTCHNDAEIINVSMATPDAQPLKVSIMADIPSSIEDTISDMNDYHEIYTPDGIRISKPQRGINIIKHSDNRISKIYIR